MKTLVVYHANCPDGRAAAWVMQRHYPDATLLARHYDASFDETIRSAAVDADVFYVDFSTSRDSLIKLCAVAKSVTVLDHHKTAREELTAFVDPPKNLRIAFDMSRCGAMLAWDYLCNPRYMPLSEIRVGSWDSYGNTVGSRVTSRFIEYVQDRDLWTWALPNSREVSAWMSSFPDDLLSCDVMSQAIDNDLKSVVHMGAAILQFQKRRIEAVLRNAMQITIQGPNATFYQVPCVNTASFISEVGEALTAAYPAAPFSATFFIRSDGKRVWSLRVSQDKNFDASAIAKHHGGGGHAKACGWTEGASNA